MNASLDPSSFDDEEKPLDPATERVRRKMVRLMVVSIGIMTIGLMAVFGAIVYKFTNLGGSKTENAGASDSKLAESQTGSFKSTIDIPDGASIVSTALDGTRISLTLGYSDGKQEIWLYDIATDRMLGKISVK